MSPASSCIWLAICLLTTIPVNAIADDASRSGEVVVSDDVRIHYVHQGRNDSAPALLLIPGWGMDASIWSRQIAEFAKTHRVVAIDPRSQGASSKTSDGNTPQTRAGDIDAVMRKLSLDRVVLVGWSQGVQDVAAYVDGFGTARIAGLVLVDSPVAAGAAGVAENPKAAQLTFERLSIYAAHPREYLQGMMQAIFIQPMPEAERQRRLQVALQMPVTTGIAMLTQDLYGADLRPALRKFDRPTLVIAAASSPELAAQEGLAAQIPGATLVRIDDAGHGVFVDQPGRFNDALRGFLARLEP
ncbi:MAG TPA: alpha/beta hydrolase [Lysobacter sp.]|nr:alpha/beta hydrolase [Lysobacter sp.]